jgi:glycosyltransferase involved in cell wall biosynthesis
MKTLVIVPTKNEEQSIRWTLEQLKGENVVVCDGGSTDGTTDIANEMGVTVLHCASGYGVVILDGFRYGLENGYDQMIVIDCESHTFTDIVPYLECGADVIAGLRQGEKKPWYRKLITKVGRKMKPHGVKTEIIDISNGFRAYSRKFVEYILSLPKMDEIPSYTFNSILAFYAGEWSVVQFPMSYIGGKSGLNTMELLKAWNFRSGYTMQKPPLDLAEVTLDDVVSFLKLYYGSSFTNHCLKQIAKRRND